MFVCFIFILNSVTRKRRTVALYLDESVLAEELSISEFFGCFFDFIPLNLLVQSHQAEIIIVKRLIQGRNSVWDEVGVKLRSRYRKTVAVKTALNPLGHAADKGSNKSKAKVKQLFAYRSYFVQCVKQTNLKLYSL